MARARFGATPVGLLVGAITLVALLLRLRAFGDSLFGDELSTYYTVAGHGLGRTLDIVRSDQELNPPLYFVLAWISARLGDAPELLRLPSLLAGVAAVPLTYLLGVRTVGRTAALVGAALMALSPFVIFYSTEARAYALMVLLALLSTLALLQALDSGRGRWWVAYALCSCAALYTHYTVVFVLAAQFLWAFATRPASRRALVAATAAAVLGFVPWLPEFLKDSRSACAGLINSLQPFGLDAIRTDLGRWAAGHPFVTLASLPGQVALALLVLGLLAGALGVVWRVRGDRSLRSRPRAGLVLVLALALATPVGAAAASLVGNSVFLPRNLIASWPGLALAVGALLTAARGLPRLVAVTLVLGSIALGGLQMLYARNQRLDYAAAVRFVERTGGPGDAVVEVPFPTPGPFGGFFVARAEIGASAAAGQPLFLLGYPSIATELRARRPGGVGPCAAAFLRAPAAAAIAAQATGRPGPRELFLVNIGSASIAGLRALSTSPAAQFVAALPPRYRYVGVRTFPGFAGVDLSVYVFRVG